MPESNEHKTAKELLRRGHLVAQPIGETLLASRVDAPERKITKGPARGRRPDSVFFTEEGIQVRVEINAGSKIRPDKLSEYERGGTPVLEVPVPRTQAEFTQWIARANPFEQDGNRWVFVPDPKKLAELAHSPLRCAYPQCDQLATGYKGNVYIDAQLTFDNWEGSQYLADNRIIGCTLPRFACQEHQVYAASLVMPGGLKWSQNGTQQSEIGVRLPLAEGMISLKPGNNIIRAQPVASGEQIFLGDYIRVCARF